MAAGLLAQEDEGLSVPVISQVDESRQGVLAVYAADALEKLSVFDDLYARVDTLKRIANARLLYKNVSVSSDGLRVTNMDGSDLELEMLSSGEQHELVLLYDLLFDVTKNSLILIDEPELSLHVAWQRQILSGLQTMANLSDFRVLLATHSPKLSVTGGTSLSSYKDQMSHEVPRARRVSEHHQDAPYTTFRSILVGRR